MHTNRSPLAFINYQQHGRQGTPLIGAIQGKIVIDEYDLIRAQLEDGTISLLISYIMV